DDGPAFRRRQCCRIDEPAIARSIGIAQMRAIPNAGPLWGVGLDPLAKLFVLRATAWQYGDEAPAGAIDIVHVLARAQLGVGDVEEVCPPRHGAQGVPSLDVGARVTGVAITAAKGDGDIAVGGHSEDEQELLE